MNDENEMILDSAQDAAVESPEETAQGGEQSAGADEQAAAEQEPAEEQGNAEDEFEAQNERSGGESYDDADYDDYDSFYHDLDEIERDLEQDDGEDELDEDEESEEDEGGDTTTDPESEDGDNGENEDEDTAEKSDTDEGGDESGAEGAAKSDTEMGTDNTATADDGGEPAAASDGGADYASWEAEDRAAIIKAYPELEGVLRGKHLSEVLDDPDLFGYMRGSAKSRAKYSAVDAFEKASAKLLADRAAKGRAKAASKQHITSSNGKAAAGGKAMDAEMRSIFRDMFPDMTPAEREKLFNSVT